MVSFGDFGFYFAFCFSVAYQTICLVIIFGQVYDGEMWQLWDGEAVCFWLFSLFLSVCWLEKLMLSHGAFVVVIERSRNVYDI
jgi:hypothetical protein